tara:strand:+ start:434 stop:1765 length:1332 start_codon:yes stop_codon:yes gene_type:complete
MGIVQGHASVGAEKKVLATNYVSEFDITKEYDVAKHNALAKIYGEQSVVGFMEMEKKESGFAADSFTILEEARLYNAYTEVTNAGGTADVFAGLTAHTIRVGELIRVTGAGKSAQVGIVTAVSANGLTASCYNAAAWDVHATLNHVYAFGSEFKKGSDAGMSEGLKEKFQSYTYKPTIQRDSNIATGSELSDIGWVNTPAGMVWFWYGESKAKLRFTDRTDLTAMLAVPAAAGSGAIGETGIFGTQGMFNAIETRGIVSAEQIDSKAEYRSLINLFDAEGQIKDNLVYMNRATSDGVDDFLAQENGAFAGGFNWGQFDNKETALDLGFNGFRLGSYSFAKSDLRLLNDSRLLGGELGVNKISSLIIPNGKNTVYDETGAIAAEHYLECKYKVANGENRKYKTWAHGGAGGQSSSGADKLTIERLTERLVALTGANNFALAKSA